MSNKLIFGLIAVANIGILSSIEAKPNVVFILVDDLGYGDLGCYGQKNIETPNIDCLASNGIRFTQHYSGSPVSAPSRSSLMTGLHTGNSPIKGNDEMTERGNVWNHKIILDNPSMEGQVPLPEGTVTLAHIFKDRGYKTAMIGKWGLGYPNSNSTPNKMGFDFFYGLNCQRQAHTYYPMFLYRNERREYLNNAPLLTPQEKLDKGANPNDQKSYDKFLRKDYMVDKMFEEVTAFIDENSNNSFFLMWTTPLPHLPLQAPQRWIDYYNTKFGAEVPFNPNRGGWLPARSPRATYAAMVSYLDEQVGQVVEQLKKLGILDNTIIVITSDNGPTATGGVDYQFFNCAGVFNSEPGWGKGYTHEGGVRVPMIISWRDKIKDTRESDHICAFWDWMPTFGEIIGVKKAPKTDGLSFVNELIGKNQKKHNFLYWEFADTKGQKAARIGKWKVIETNSRFDPKIQVFNIETDPREQIDLAAHNPEIIEQFTKLKQSQHTDSPYEQFNF